MTAWRLKKPGFFKKPGFWRVRFVGFGLRSTQPTKNGIFILAKVLLKKPGFWRVSWSGSISVLPKDSFEKIKKQGFLPQFIITSFSFSLK